MPSAERPGRDKSFTLSSLPPIPQDDIRAQIRARVPSSPLLVVLDDDPTSTQTCHDMLVLTRWASVDDIKSVAAHPLTQKSRGFFILTNTRAEDSPDARKLLVEICEKLRTALGSQPFEVVLRSDSTLRGHFPLETDVVQETLGEADVCLLAPFFLEGDRYTIDDVHYVAEGDSLVPAAQTQFAWDAPFKYKSSNLRNWVVEKSQGSIPVESVKSLSIEEIRQGGVATVTQRLMEFERGTIAIVNAMAQEDLDIVVLAALEATAKGRKLIYRSGAALVSSRLSMAPMPLISPANFSSATDAGGLIIAGSYLSKTTSQLSTLRDKSGSRLTTIHTWTNDFFDPLGNPYLAVAATVEAAGAELKRGQDVLIMTDRNLYTGRNERESLIIRECIKNGLCHILGDLTVRPRYIIAKVSVPSVEDHAVLADGEHPKGAITSSVMPSMGLRMRCATVVGQAAAGVPIWRCDEGTSKWPGIPFILFPGNAGSDDTLFQIVDGWRA